jgi:hypothetical protein
MLHVRRVPVRALAPFPPEPGVAREFGKVADAGVPRSQYSWCQLSCTWLARPWAGCFKIDLGAGVTMTNRWSPAEPEVGIDVPVGVLRFPPRFSAVGSDTPERSEVAYSHADVVKAG